MDLLAVLVGAFIGAIVVWLNLLRQKILDKRHKNKAMRQDLKNVLLATSFPADDSPELKSDMKGVLSEIFDSDEYFNDNPDIQSFKKIGSKFKKI